MYTATQTNNSAVSHPGKALIVTGWILTGLSSLMLLMDGAMKIAKPAPVIQATMQLGYPESQITGIGIVLLVCTILYLIPRTAVLGAMLLTGYLGGAVASQVRIGQVPFSIVFPIIVACFVWGGLYLREERLHDLVPFRK